jgi:hypothetical protein
VPAVAALDLKPAQVREMKHPLFGMSERVRVSRKPIGYRVGRPDCVGDDDPVQADRD